MRKVSMVHRLARAVGAALIGVVLCAAGAVPAGAAAATTLAWVCRAQGAFTPVGNPLVADPVASLTSTIAAPLSDPATVTATPQVQPGGVIHYHVTIDFNVTARAQLLLNAFVIPTISSPAQFDSPTIAATAELNLHIAQFVVVLPQPDGASFVGTPTVSSGSAGPVTSVSSGPSGLRIAIGPVTGSARQATSPPSDTTTPDTGPFTVTLDAQAQAGAANGVVTLHPGDLSVQFQGPNGDTAGYDIGVIDPAEGGTLRGGWNGLEHCDVTDQVLASTTVGTGATTTTSTTTSSALASATSSVPASASAPPSTAQPSTTALPSTTILSTTVPTTEPAVAVVPADGTAPLARTGMDVREPLLGGAALLALGVMVVLATRRRTRPDR